MSRPVESQRGWSAAPVRHGVSAIRSGERRTLALVFYDRIGSGRERDAGRLRHEVRATACGDLPGTTLRRDHAARAALAATAATASAAATPHAGLLLEGVPSQQDKALIELLAREIRQPALTD